MSICIDRYLAVVHASSTLHRWRTPGAARCLSALVWLIAVVVTYSFQEDKEEWRYGEMEVWGIRGFGAMLVLPGEAHPPAGPAPTPGCYLAKPNPLLAPPPLQGCYLAKPTPLLAPLASLRMRVDRGRLKGLSSVSSSSSSTVTGRLETYKLSCSELSWLQVSRVPSRMYLRRQGEAIKGLRSAGSPVCRVTGLEGLWSAGSLVWRSSELLVRDVTDPPAGRPCGGTDVLQSSPHNMYMPHI
ncbi:hypothetical protein CRUP_036574 [Coryphaenoides rupestris]|nr:hypothetical protein CRUP_036574 [Coryphaenoides rupestris]